MCDYANAERRIEEDEKPKLSRPYEGLLNRSHANFGKAKVALTRRYEIPEIDQDDLQTPDKRQRQC